MPQAQFGVCAEPNLHALYLLCNALEGKDPLVRQALSRLPEMFERYSDHFSESVVSGMVAVGANYWDTLFPDGRPAELRPFPAMQSEDRVAPSEPYDLFIQVRSDRADVNHIIGTQICKMLEGCVELVEQVKGFRYLDGRDLTGFVDGTENPKGVHKQKVALVGEEDTAFAGGSYIHIQRYRHNMQAWEKLEEQQQEDIIGRTKRENIEYASDKKPPTCHIKRASVKDANGNSLEILRQSMPYGHMKVQGLFFISCAASPLPFELMLKSMIHGDEHGNHDHMLNYTEAETGAAFFAPSLSFLKRL